jgi:hypothetical protein
MARMLSRAPIIQWRQGESRSEMATIAQDETPTSSDSRRQPLSRLRKKGRCDLDSPSLRDFVTRGGVLGCIRWCPADLCSGLRIHCDLGLHRLNRQIPHTD